MIVHWFISEQIYYGSLTETVHSHTVVLNALKHFFERKRTPPLYPYTKV
jgi:hypothetical protein